jgi:protein-S-isoprenylcysteine O-methyltransferase Ste14
MLRSFLKSILHNVFVVAVGFAFALLGTGVDRVFGFPRFHSAATVVIGVTLLTTGFLLRVWAAYYFYKHQMNVIVLSAQSHLITTGPYRFSRNPLYVGGNVFIFLGASLILGTPGGLVLTVLQLPLVNFMIRREERQLEQKFGHEWREYAQRTRRWI